MAPSRGKVKARAQASSTRASRSAQKAKDDVPDVYQDLLAEASVVAPDDLVDRPLKKRKVGTAGRAPTRDDGDDDDDRATSSSVVTQRVKSAQQTVEDFSQFEDDDSDDLAFEDVDLNQATDQNDTDDDNEVTEDISISIAPTTSSKRRSTARKPISQAEKSFRILTHKAHILCLMAHCMYINGRCNNEVVQHNLRSTLLTKKTISYLNPKTEDSQFQRNRSFMDGLQQAVDAFRGAWVVSGSGMRRARWPDDDSSGVRKNRSDDIEPMDRSEFVAASREFEGSQDTGNQLFCALLRSAGVEARLCCSLQVLPFGNRGKVAASTPQKTMSKTTIYASSTTSPATTSNTNDTSVQHSTSNKVPPPRRRLGQPTFHTSHAPGPNLPNKSREQPTRKLTHPIFWTEAFNIAQQKWISLDPLVTQTLGKNSKLEPPSSYSDLNQMSYVFAFEADGVARDVTRRYAKAYNAKTRRTRIDCTGEEGVAWLKKVLRFFRRRGGKLDREQLEDAELAQREAREGLPGNVQDFKGHPLYALERHLRRHEVVHPKRRVGDVNAGTAKAPRMEVVYRREDVLVCWSAEKWFRGFGREVKKGEQAVKYVPARQSRKGQDVDVDGDGDGEVERTPLYGHFQTEEYVPPPVMKGKVPRNAFGNIDVYVPSMVPAGGVHIRHTLAQHAAKILRVDYADAVTGFKFQGRHGTPVTEGVVVATQYADAVRAVVEGLQDEQAEEESKARSALALRVWRRFLTGLRIRERVSGYGGDGGGDTSMEIDEREGEEERAGQAGGFFAGEETALPTAGRFSLDGLDVSAKTTEKGKKRVEESSEEEAQFTSDDGGDFATRPEVVRRSTRATRRTVVEESDEDLYEPAEDDGAGGFVPDEFTKVDYGGGGFMVHEDMDNDFNGSRFIPDHDDLVADEGGGFLHDDTGMDNTGEGGFLAEPNVEDTPGHNVMTVGIPGGVLLEDQSEQQKSTVSQKDDGGLNERLLLIGNGHDDRMNQTTQARSSEELPVNGMDAVGGKIPEASCGVDEGQDAQSDFGSMLSHDPEDEDAEPDWLESD